MQELVSTLEKRKSFILKVLALFASLALVFNFFVTLSCPQYFDGKYNMYFVYALIVYKIIELFIIYYILMHRHILYMKKNPVTNEFKVKLTKHTKVLLFLIIQGNTVFGVIAFKLSANVLFFLLFSCIALAALLLFQPKKLL
ncbi:hypothetical protein JHD49_03245 [Sulfurimonas sp. SAG-AH-194-C21]|nr:hypothetical protein [Sulfurimonas sp. SAG-AH-194-C21]MDF1882948.1 hypothetical protein [Sulfurimonas sp. SAG-AH-194-C21]